MLAGQPLLEQFFDKIHMGHDHAPAAVALASKLIHRITCKVSDIKLAFRAGLLSPVSYFIIEHFQIALPHISNDLRRILAAVCGPEEVIKARVYLAARKASHRNYHFVTRLRSL